MSLLSAIEILTSFLGWGDQLGDGVAGVASPHVEMLKLGVAAFKLCSLQTELVPLARTRHCLCCTAFFEFSFAKCCQCDSEPWSEQTINVFAVDAVNRLPLNIDESWVADDDVVVGQFQIDRYLLREVSCH